MGRLSQAQVDQDMKKEQERKAGTAEWEKNMYTYIKNVMSVKFVYKLFLLRYV